jgi:hypothetical protein
MRRWIKIKALKGSEPQGLKATYIQSKQGRQTDQNRLQVRPKDSQGAVLMVSMSVNLAGF